MMHSNFILVSTALVLLSAGVVVGRLSDRLQMPQTHAFSDQRRAPDRDRSRSWLADQLKLSGDQRQKMDGIWADTRRQIEGTFESRHALDQRRDAAILSLLTPEQLAAYNKINDDYRMNQDNLFKDRNKFVADANDGSRALLDEDQQKKWDILSKEMGSRLGPPGAGLGRGPGGPGPKGMGTPGERFPGDRVHGDRPRGDRPPNRPTTKPTGGAEGFRAGADNDHA
jgi:hypothetical protein